MIGQLASFWGGGELNNAQVFDGVFNYDQIADNLGIVPGQSLTFYLRYRIDFLQSQQRLFLIGQDAGTRIAITYIGSNIRFIVTAGSNTVWTMPNPFVIGELIDQIITYDTSGGFPGVVTFYNNGVKTVRDNGSGGSAPSGTFPDFTTIATTETGTLNFNGLIQKVQVLDFVATDAQAAEVLESKTFRGVTGVNNSDFLLDFNANKKLPNTPTDDSDNAYSITVNGGLSYSPFEDS